jgi:uncharacterized protein DUF1848
VIVSASFRTDIPAFYGRWFINRLRAGACEVRNPYGGQIYTVSLTREDVDGFVFWTKNIGPFLRHLPEVRERGFPFIVQHTINGYPRALESRVAHDSRTIGYVRRVSATYGSDVVVWRYDPILLSSLTPPDWHRRRFASLARRLEGATNEVTVSFAQVYQKTRRNLNAAAREHGFTWDEHERVAPDDLRALLVDLAQIAAAHGMRMTACSQRALLIPGLISEARCVDAERLARVAGAPLPGKARLKGNRPECGCYESRDIGAYDTCPHGCVYCYAVQDRDLALRRYRRHDPESAVLLPAPPAASAS